MPRKPNAVVYNPSPGDVGLPGRRTFPPGWSPVLRNDVDAGRLVELGQLQWAAKPKADADLDDGARAAWAAVDTKFAAAPAPVIPPAGNPPAGSTSSSTEG